MKRGRIVAFLIIIAAISFFLVGSTSEQDSYQAEINRINLEIDLQGLEWRAGMTSLTKLPPEEKRQRLGTWIPYEADPNDVLFLEPLEPEPQLPASINWTSKDGRNYMTSVKNQGSCGSCWAFGTLGVVEAIYNTEKGRYSIEPAFLLNNSLRSEWFSAFYEQNPIRIQALNYPDFSEQELVSCSTAGDCGGGFISKACHYVQNSGIVPENCFPYQADDVACQRCTNYLQKLSRISNWAWIATSTIQENAIKTTLQNGPVIATMDVYSDFYNYSSGIYSPTAGAAYEGGHCIIFVGYNNNQNSWICKNSWGTNWGVNGYFRIKRGSCDTGKWVAKVWGITINNNPPVLAAIGAQSTKEGLAISIQANATDPDGDTLTYSVSSLPSGASFNNSSGLFTWTPSFTQSGTYSVKFSVTDELFEDYETINITVINVKKGKGIY
jgi:hypothetical protein